uniref:TLC domain-containing protein n=1 Tax=Fibrocapsa japonica TaxID=94617 RepID=A0A7S2V1S4_9STRA|mmetsp:Transcript_24218/g.35215  ORF Transcript_24218/g.35215 Transcript_24218/m.35215 type:complete len:257 (+) Transcript_24218:77-847(+)|eukprot:CAMPEP_0113943468 /NCGR_PEP_ID=MMETSP1339-20121228/24649_1 /TAXON_ID=94617 /ORGANISM="Fibrocapsa japonica" /LENGTH=256 /DNA_ID=CAMNT_0000948349 /DNA_START=70 /DNA_END=840 /DNA_ORIENTATION=+ /assembly_acc=CAM_ASM_000762
MDCKVKRAGFDNVGPEKCNSRNSIFQQHVPEKLEKGGWNPSKLSELHDSINLVWLTVLASLAIVVLLSFPTCHSLLVLMTTLTTVYIALDAIWIFMFPSSIKSPVTVCLHHISTLAILLGPIFNAISGSGLQGYYTAAAIIVEANTVLLTMRRKFKFGLWVEIPFALSWVLIRLVWYPILGFYFMVCAFHSVRELLAPQFILHIRETIEGPEPEPLWKLSAMAFVLICMFQIFWSVPLVKSWMRRLNGIGKQNHFL